jgi:outer membrane protein assembly factor BamB/tetratricopeptide (TPR) repeat protein
LSRAIAVRTNRAEPFVARRNQNRLSFDKAARHFFCLTALILAIGPSSISRPAVAGEPPRPVAIDRDLQQPFAEAQSLIGREHFADAMRILQPILNDPQNKLAFLNSRYLDAKVAANQLIASFPPGGLAAYEREYGKFADEDLKRAQAAGKVEDVLRVCTQYRHTAAGQQALAVAAGIFFDRGQFLEAAAASRELLELPEATDQPAAAARLVLSWARMGQSDRAQRWIDGRRASLSKSQIDVQKHGYRLDAWLDELLRDNRAVSADALANTAAFAGGHPQSLMPRVMHPPTTLSLWNKRLSVTGTSGALIDELISRRAATGVAPVFHGIPLVVRETVIVRTGDELAAYDLRTGRTLWSHDVSPPGGGDNVNGFRDPTMPIVTETLVDRQFAGAPHTAISTDGERVFTVVEDVAPSTPNFSRRRRFAIESPPKNSLVAFDRLTGKRLWRLAEVDAPPTESAAETRDVDFLGPPLAHGGTLYVLARTEDAAHLLALGPDDGKVRWSQSLAGFSGFEADSVSWSGPSCMPVECEGLLLCPTPDGLVIAVDLVMRSVRWAYRVEPVEEPARLPPRWGRAFAGAEARWLTSWRESLVRTDAERCYFVSPRSPQVHALALKTGELVWSRPIAGGLYLGPLEQGRLITVAKYRCSAWEPSTGKPLWNAAVDLPSGRGLVLDAHYYLPCTSGMAIDVDLQNGQTRQIVTAGSETLGNLVAVPASAGVAAVAQSHELLIVLPTLDAQRSALAAKLREQPQNVEARNRLALLDREAGDFESAERRLEALIATLAPKPDDSGKKEPDAPPARFRHELLETLLADLEASPRRSNTLAERVEHTADTEQRARSLRRLALARRRAGQTLEAFDTLLLLAQSELPPTLDVERGPARVVAFDRQLRADLMDLLADCSLPQFREARARLLKTVQAALTEGDVDTLRRVSDRLGFAEWDPQLREKIDAALRPEPGYLREQLALWESAAHRDRGRGAEAMRRLAETYLLHGERKLAATCYRRLRDDFPDVRFADGLACGELIGRACKDRRLSAEIEMTLPDPWPAEQPHVHIDSISGVGPNFFPLPMERTAGSVFERMDVALDREGKTLRFQGEPRATPWDLTLPVDTQSFRGFQTLHRGWGIGQLLIVQDGGDLYGVTPLDDGGEANPRFLWHIDLLPAEEVASNDIVMPIGRGMAGLFTDRTSMIDHLGRPVARIVAVQPGSICCLDRGSLTAYDPLTGRLLWRRTDAAPADSGSGDESLVVLLDRRGKRVEFLRTLDGKQIAERRLAAKSSELKWLEGRDALIQSVDPGGMRVTRIDLLANEIKWTRLFATASHLVRLDSGRYALAEPDGTCQLLNAATGVPVTTEKIAGTEHCLQLYATGDEQRYYIAFSKPFADSENVRPNGQRDDSRNPLVNGMITAFDRMSGKLLWSRRFDDGVFELDQSRVAPALVFSYRHVEKGDDEGIPWPYLHAIDKRTGRDLHLAKLTNLQPASHPWAEADTARHEFQVRVPEAVVHFQYAK